MMWRALTRGRFSALNSSARASRRHTARSRRESLEILEGRQLLATFTVTNLNASGPGSLRTAIVESNSMPGADTIDFGVSGTIATGRRSLPAITGRVTIDGASAPTFAGAPVVTIDFQGSRGLTFNRGSNGSVLRSLSIVNAGGAGVTLNSSNNTLEGNYIGLLADGQTIAGNRGDGVRINASSHGNLIGYVDPVTTVDFYDASGISIQPVSGWQGIRAGATTGEYLLTGTSNTTGLLYVGPINGQGGTTYPVNYPSATATSVYGPDLLPNGDIRLVGSYKQGEDVVNGFLYEGSIADLSQSTGYRTIDYPGAKYTYIHSTIGNLAVGNADGPEGDLPVGTGHAILYDIANDKLLPDIVYPGSTSTTAYGIWYNGGTSYTIAGGYSLIAGSGGTIGKAYLVDYDSATGQYTHWTSFDYQNGAPGHDFITHFEGISSQEKGVYTMSADTVQSGNGANNPVQGSWVTVRRNTDGSFGPAVWVDLNAPGTSAFSSNSVAGNQVVGIAFSSGGVSSMQASVNSGFQLSNVISGNSGNGIGIYGSNDNRVSMNQIGTDVTGTLARGNGRNGILVSAGARRNLIGGEATGGNNPTANVFFRPPQGNLISGNRANGVLINQRSSQTQLSGNYIGTTASGNEALGNALDGVAIDGANGNSLLGCTFQESPFVFYNVVSGNGGNGLRVTNSNNTTVQANFLGIGANNASIVANGGDGVLVSGSSRNVQIGGVIPLGNVISGNAKNGTEIRDRASGVISFNTFAGVYAFGGAAPNGQNGFLITSSGGNNTIRTCIVSGNLGNGIELNGQARGVQITDTAVGTNTAIQTAIPNRGSGIRIAGNAHDNAIGGFQPSVEPQVTVSANGRYGIEIVGNARRNVIYHTKIGTTAEGTGNLGNALSGIYLGAGTSATTIGGDNERFAVLVSNSGGDGVAIESSKRNTIVGNRLLNNLGYGLQARGNCAGTIVRGNAISGNAQGNVNLTESTGVTYLP